MGDSLNDGWDNMSSDTQGHQHNHRHKARDERRYHPRNKNHVERSKSHRNQGINQHSYQHQDDESPASIVITDDIEDEFLFDNDPDPVMDDRGPNDLYASSSAAHHRLGPAEQRLHKNATELLQRDPTPIPSRRTTRSRHLLPLDSEAPRAYYDFLNEACHFNREVAEAEPPFHIASADARWFEMRRPRSIADHQSHSLDRPRINHRFR
jgi:hypothetical protein